MSETEVRHREGMPFGGMPHDVLLYRLEETDPALMRDAPSEDPYDDYIRSEIIDRTPDAPFFESDHARRDPALSRSVLNLRYNGTRGSRPELPRHPEMFIGFTGNDPRGSGTDPRFEQVRGHITSRAGNLTVAMGDNDDHHEAERPWTGQAISYGQKEIHRRLKNNTRVFSTQNEGRPWARNIDISAARNADRSRAVAEAGESLPGARAGGEAPAAEATDAGVRGVDSAQGARSPWRHTGGDARLSVQRYGQTRGAGRGRIGAGADGGGRVTAAGGDHDWATGLASRSANRQILAATMARAAQSRRTAAAGIPDQKPGTSRGPTGAPGGGMIPARDVARAYYASQEDQDRRPAGGVTGGEKARLGGAAGLTPAAHPERVAHASHTSGAMPGARLANIESLASGLRHGSSAEQRRVAGLGIVDPIAAGACGATAAVSGGLAPSADFGRTSLQTRAVLPRPGAAELKVHTYSGFVPAGPEPRAALGQGALDAATLRAQRETLPQGKSGAPGARRSATRDPVALGDAPERVFGLPSEHAPGSAVVGPKSLRAGSQGDTTLLAGELHDRFGN